MFQLAVYGKGGIGKSTMSANISLMLAQRGHRVMQIGCDPKHDSTRLLIGGGSQRTVLDYVREVPERDRRLEDVMVTGSGGVMCIESGGPEPGIGCAGRGILTAFDTIRRLGADDSGADVRLYDVLGDVVCGGFAMPIRNGYADQLYIVTSGEMMSLYAADNIARAVKNVGKTGYAVLKGLILNKKNIEGEDELTRKAAEEMGTKVVFTIPRDKTVQAAEALGKTVVEAFPDSEMSRLYMKLAEMVAL